MTNRNTDRRKPRDPLLVSSKNAYARAKALAKLLVLRKTEDGYVLEFRSDEDFCDMVPFFEDWEDMNKDMDDVLRARVAGRRGSGE